MSMTRLVAVAAGLLAAAGAGAAPVGTGFTYQGQLKLSGVSVNGPADMIFRLYDSAGGNGQVGPTLTFDGAGGNPAPVSVTGGLFKVELDFGAAAFTGTDLYLDIQARVPAGAAAAYTVLTPRQRLSATPYALYALNSAGGNTLDEAYDQGGPGAGRTINADSGAVQINGNGGLVVGTTLHVVPTLSFVGVNRNTRLTANEVFGITANTASSFGGMYINTSGAAGLPFYGYATAGVVKGYQYYDGGDDTWKFDLNGTRMVVERSTGNVGIGDTTPEARLRVSTPDTDGISGSTTAAFSYGVKGTGTSAGVYGESGASGGSGVEGRNNNPGGQGMKGSNSSVGGAGVAGYANFGTGIYGQTADGYGIYGSSSGGSGYAGYFNGKVHVAGNLTKTGGTFLIDHPLDPKNKTLSHSFVESPERMNVYNGNVTLDADGKATVGLPAWFSALNKDYRYQLTAIGGAGPNLHIAREIADNSFDIAGGTAGLKVSWQVTGVRQDAWAKANPLEVEADKPEAQRGLYLNPEVFGAQGSQSADFNVRASAAVAAE